ncbi:hypothetical protein CDAR_296871 [Caerostris darwini]|uniref:Uncharacterized protein n=1 Tax=Caerostris darwini TaxID=1538125 RepID=A0AAV4N905_9ARAC|nr:hypothetical protein CDAR_296871 [Caerostris darwini]
MQLRVNISGLKSDSARYLWHCVALSFQKTDFSMLVHYHILRAMRLRLRYSSLWENSDVYHQVRTITYEKRPFEIRNYSISARGVGNAKYLSQKAFRCPAS